MGRGKLTTRRVRKYKRIAWLRDIVKRARVQTHVRPKGYEELSKDIPSEEQEEDIATDVVQEGAFGVSEEEETQETSPGESPEQPSAESSGQEKTEEAEKEGSQDRPEETKGEDSESGTEEEGKDESGKGEKEKSGEQ